MKKTLKEMPFSSKLQKAKEYIYYCRSKLDGECNDIVMYWLDNKGHFWRYCAIMPESEIEKDKNAREYNVLYDDELSKYSFNDIRREATEKGLLDMNDVEENQVLTNNDVYLFISLDNKSNSIYVEGGMLKGKNMYYDEIFLGKYGLNEL